MGYKPDMDFTHKNILMYFSAVIFFHEKSLTEIFSREYKFYIVTLLIHVCSYTLEKKKRYREGLWEDNVTFFKKSDSQVQHII